MLQSTYVRSETYCENIVFQDYLKTTNVYIYFPHTDRHIVSETFSCYFQESVITESRFVLISQAYFICFIPNSLTHFLGC